MDTRRELDVLGPTGISRLVPGSTCNIPALSRSSLKEGAMQAMGVSVGYIDATVLVSGTDICNPSNRAWHQQYSQCGRAVVEAMAPLLIAKMALAALLLPAIRILQWRVAPAGWSAFVQGLPGRCRRRCRKKAATTDDNGGNDAATSRRHRDNVCGHGGRVSYYVCMRACCKALPSSYSKTFWVLTGLLSTQVITLCSSF